MNKFTGYLLIGFAILLYLVSAFTFASYLYSLTIPDTVSAIESAFGTLVLLTFMLVLAKKSMDEGKTRLRQDEDRADG